MTSRFTYNKTNMGDFHPLQVVGRGSETQLEEDENVGPTLKQQSVNLSCLLGTYCVSQ